MPSQTNHSRSTDAVEIGDCENCYACLKDKWSPDGWPVTATRMILCPLCGNKRCPKATLHTLNCTNSNEPGQSGSRY